MSDTKIVKVMPSHYCMILESTMEYFGDPSLTDDDREKVAEILGTVRLTAGAEGVYGRDYRDRRALTRLHVHSYQRNG